MKVKATTAVAGMWCGETYEVLYTDFIQLLLNVGHLVDVTEYEDLPEEDDSSIPLAEEEYDIFIPDILEMEEPDGGTAEVRGTVPDKVQS